MTVSPRARILAINTLFQLEREYRKTRDGRLAFRAASLAWRADLPLPPWVLAFLDEASLEIALSQGDPKRIAKAVKIPGIGPNPKNDNERVYDALQFMPGDFQGVGYGVFLDALRTELSANIKRPLKKRKAHKAKK